MEVQSQHFGKAVKNWAVFLVASLSTVSDCYLVVTWLFPGCSLVVTLYRSGKQLLHATLYKKGNQLLHTLAFPGRCYSMQHNSNLLVCYIEPAYKIVKLQHFQLHVGAFLHWLMCSSHTVPYNSVYMQSSRCL